MIDFERMLQGFRPEQFRREDLRKRRWTLPPTQYFIRLDAYAAWLEEQVLHLQRERAQSGNKFYQQDAKEWGKQWNELQRKFGKLQAEKITLEAEKDAEIRRLKLENEYLQEQLEAYEEAENPKSQRKRNNKTGQFVADMPKLDKMWKAYDMDRRGYKHTQIARELNISPETVKRYIRDYPNEWAKSQGIQQDEDVDETGRNAQIKNVWE